MDAVIAVPGDGEVISDSEERELRILAAREELAFTWSRYAPGESGPGAHVHREHADCFYVLEGRLVFELGGERCALEAGGFVSVPPGVVHTFRNEGPGDSVYLNFHAPSKGFDEHLRALRDGDEGASERFDTFDPPDDGGRPASDAIVRGPGGGEKLEAGGSVAVIKAGGDDEPGSFSLGELTLAPGFPGPLPHRHRTFCDSFYVLEGTLTVLAGDRTVDAPPGTYALIPPGMRHTFANPGTRPVRALNVMAPGGFERYLREAAAAMRPGEPPDPQVMAEIASRYDFEPV